MGRKLLVLCLSIWISIHGQAEDRLQPAENAGQAAMARGDYRGAEVFYRKAVAEHPSSAEAFTALGVSVQMQGRSGEAIHLFEHALSLKALPHTYALLAEEKCETRDLEGARPMLAKILQAGETSMQDLALVAPCYLDLDQPLEAVQAYNSVLSSGVLPSDLVLIQLAKSYRRAAQHFFNQLSAAPGSYDYVQAIKQARDAQSSNARSAFAEAAGSSPYFRADLSFPDAVALWKQHPSDAALLYLLCVLSGEESMKAVETCASTYPDSSYLQELTADMLAERGNHDAAVQAYESLMQSHPEMAGPRYSLAMLYRKNGEWEKSLEVFQAQLTLDPTDEQSASGVSESLLNLGRWQELSTFLQPRMNSGMPPLWTVLDMAQAEQKLGRNDKALQILVAAEKENMSNQTLHYRLMRLYAAVNKPAEAQKERVLFEQGLPNRNR